MAYDADLADRIREKLAAERGVSEQAMFGGLGFLVDGHLAVAASSHGGLLLRIDPAQSEQLLTDPHASRFAMRGREMDGWLRIDADGARTDADLGRWTAIGVRYVRSLPPR